MSHHSDDAAFSARTPFSLLFGVLSAALLPVALVLTWVSAVGTRTDTFVETVAPVVKVAAVQQALTTSTTNEVLQRLALPNRLRAAASAPIRESVATVIASNRFANVWAAAITTTHEQLVARMSQPAGSTSEGLVVQVRVPLDGLQGRLTPFGLTVPLNFAPTGRVSVLSAAQVERLRPPWHFASRYGIWAAIVAVGLGVLAVGVAVLRRRSAAWLLVGWGLGLALLAAALALARPITVSAVVRATGVSTTSGGTAASVRAVADAAYDAVATGLGRWLLIGGIVVVAALLVLLVARLVDGRGRGRAVPAGR